MFNVDWDTATKEDERRYYLERIGVATESLKRVIGGHSLKCSFADIPLDEKDIARGEERIRKQNARVRKPSRDEYIVDLAVIHWAFKENHLGIAEKNVWDMVFCDSICRTDKSIATMLLGTLEEAEQYV